VAAIGSQQNNARNQSFQYDIIQMAAKYGNRA